ncbi:hypothetical protein ACLVWU_10860 [Bdellovibrio sp. HCB290]|uniref:hypothetical protein n=1 Tax=Bdellovibrio sp. HCB290 TaxID=3394356 RepID=UPI0039B3B30B
MKKLVLVILLIFPLQLFAGGDDSFGTRNGGNTQASEFYDLGVEVLENLNLRDSIQLSTGEDLFPQQLINLFKKTKLMVSNEPLELEGSTVEAINYPDINRIEFDGQAWAKKPKSLKYRLVIHEILGLARIQDPQYMMSSEVFKIASIGINWDMGYRPACRETRSLSTQHSAKLIRAILGTEIRSDIRARTSIPAFECRTGINLQGLDYFMCSLTPKLPQETNMKIIEILNDIGIAKYTRLENNPTVYDVGGITCTPDLQTKVTQCQILAYWNKGCQTGN